MAIELATAYISILPSTDKLASGINRDLKHAERQAAVSGKKMGKHIGGGISGGLKSVLAGGALLGAGAGLVSFFKGAIDAGAESNKVMAQTNAVLKSTKGQAGLTAKAIGDLAGSIAAKTGVDDEAIQSGENVLLTFTNVRNEVGKGNDVFNKATKLAVDMSSALGTDLKGANIQLGKALNDPVKGVTALSRVGVSFTEGQKKQIKTMVKHNNVLGAQKIILGEVNKEFGGSAAATATPFQKLQVQLGNIQEAIGQALIPMLNRMATYLAKKLPGWLATAHNAFVTVKPVIQGVANAIGRVFGFLSRNKTTIAAFAGTIGVAVVALKAYNAVTKVMAAYQAYQAVSAGTATVAQRALNASMRANVIGIVVVALAALVAGLVYAYKHSETFRKIVNGAWAGIKRGISAAWKVIKAVFRGFRTAITGGLIPATHRIKSVITTVWNAIRKTTSRVWNGVKAVLFGVFRGIRRGVTLYFKVYKTIITGIWRGVRTVTSKVWNGIKTVLTGAFGFIRGRVSRVFNAYKRIITGAWGVIRTSTSRIWNGIKNTLSNIWTRGIKPVFAALKNFIPDKVVPAFRRGTNAIGKIWRGLKAAARKPVEFLVNTVYTKGIRKMVNAIPGVPNLPALKFARGGVLPGYTPGRDVHDFYSATGGRLALSGGEAIMRPEFTKAVGGRKGVERLNALARRGGVEGTIGSFAGGGVVMDGKRLSTIAAKQIRLAEKVGHINLRIMQGGYGGSHIRASGSSHNYPGVADVSPGSKFVEKLLRRVGFAAWARNIPGRSHVGSGAHVHAVSLLDAGDAGSPQVYGSWRNHGNGLRGANNDPAPHYPWMGGLRKLLGGISTSALGGGGGGGFSFPNPLKFLSKLGSWKKTLSHMGGGFGPMISKAVGSVAGKAKDWAKDKIVGAFGKVKSFGGKLLHGLGGFLGIGGGSGSTRHIVQQMASRVGWGKGAEWAALSKLIQSESSWNPHAANPGSSARGLFQKMTSIHGPLESTVAGQTRWGLNYIKTGNYGNLPFHDPISAWAYHRRVGTYDNGGVLQPGDIAINQSKKPEAVFNNAQFKKFADGRGGNNNGSRRAVLTITNWKDGTGYFREIAQDEVDSNEQFNNTRRRMGSRV